jgi:hypothetical protein
MDFYWVAFLQKQRFNQDVTFELSRKVIVSM